MKQSNLGRKPLYTSRGTHNRIWDKRVAWLAFIASLSQKWNLYDSPLYKAFKDSTPPVTTHSEPGTFEFEIPLDMDFEKRVAGIKKFCEEHPGRYCQGNGGFSEDEIN